MTVKKRVARSIHASKKPPEGGSLSRAVKLA
jgi:hypothetical protein